MSKFRTDRLQKELQKLISAVFQGEIADRRLSGIDITRVKITKDLKLLKIYFSGGNENIDREDILELLEKS